MYVCLYIDNDGRVLNVDTSVYSGLPATYTERELVEKWIPEKTDLGEDEDRANENTDNGGGDGNSGGSHTSYKMIASSTDDERRGGGRVGSNAFGGNCAGWFCCRRTYDSSV